MHFTTGILMLVGLAAVNGRPLASNEASGCKVALAPTQPQPQNAAANILYSTLSKWANTSGSSYASSDMLDARNIAKAPFSVTFKTNVIPNFQTADELSTVLDKWVGTYLLGGDVPTRDDFAVTDVTCS